MKSSAKLYIREKNSLIYPVLYSATCKKTFESNPLTTRARLQFDAAVRCCYSTLILQWNADGRIRTCAGEAYLISFANIKFLKYFNNM